MFGICDLVIGICERSELGAVKVLTRSDGWKLRAELPELVKTGKNIDANRSLKELVADVDWNAFGVQTPALALAA